MKVDDPLVLAMARVMVASYLDFNSDEFHAAIRAAGFKNVWTAEHGEMEVLIASNDRYAVICPRGTDSAVNMAFNLLAFKTQIRLWFQSGPEYDFHRLDETGEWAEGRYHQGFYASLLLIKRDVLGALRSLHMPPRIYLTGHSLGGAVAALLALSIVPHGLCTFGQPRVADEVGAAVLDELMGPDYLRFTHNNDLVTYVPPEFMGYVHAGRRMHFDRRGILKEDYEPHVGQVAAEQVLGRIRNWSRGRALDGLGDHSRFDYLELVEGIHGVGA